MKKADWLSRERTGFNQGSERGGRSKKVAAEDSRVSLSWDEALEAMLKVRHGLSDYARRDYRRLVAQFYGIPGVSFGQNEERYADGFFNDEGIKPRTRNNRIAYLTAFWNACVERGWLAQMPVPKGRYRKSKVCPNHVWLQMNERQKLLEAFQRRSRETDSWPALRDYAMVLVALTSGVRTSELRALKAEHFDFEGNVIRLPESITKTSRARNVPFTEPRVKKVVSEAMEWHRRLFGTMPGCPLFCTETGTEMSEENFLRRFKRVAKGIGENLTPYKLRHLFGAMSVASGAVDISCLQETMGHASLTTTEQYLKFDNKRMVKAYTRANLLGLSPEDGDIASDLIRKGRRLHKDKAA